MRASGITRHGRRAAWLLVLPFLLPVTGCEDNGDTINVNGLDCGLIRDDLFRDWALTFTPQSLQLVNCDDPSFNATPVDVNGVTTVYGSVIAFASPSGASFNVVGSGPDLSNELLASVEADSCLALVQKWENDDSGWIQCIGTLDLRSNALSAVCDSMDLDTTVPPDGVPDVACTLDRPVALQVVITP